jgi:hypothetical protein
MERRATWRNAEQGFLNLMNLVEWSEMNGTAG